MWKTVFMGEPRNAEDIKPATKIIFQVYRRRWYGDYLFCVCDEVLTFDDVVIMKIAGDVVAIMRKQDFSYALSTITNEKSV